MTHVHPLVMYVRVKDPTVKGQVSVDVRVYVPLCEHGASMSVYDPVVGSVYKCESGGPRVPSCVHLWTAETRPWTGDVMRPHRRPTFT